MEQVITIGLNLAKNVYYTSRARDFSRQVGLLSRPIPLARSPEFVVCPLMCEIQAFRYFWPVSSSIVARPGRPTKESTVDAANQNTREAMTLESIERDPCKAVDLPLP